MKMFPERPTYDAGKLMGEKKTTALLLQVSSYYKIISIKKQDIKQEKVPIPPSHSHPEAFWEDVSLPV